MSSLGNRAQIAVVVVEIVASFFGALAAVAFSGESKVTNSRTLGDWVVMGEGGGGV